MITMRALIERAERHFPANPAIVPAAVGQGGPLTWAEFAVRVRRAAGALRALGVGAGDRFAILCRNGPRQAELIHAGYWMGAVAVPINYRLAPREIADILDNASPRLFAVEDHLAGLASDPVLTGRSEPRLRIGGQGADGSEPVYEALRDESPEGRGPDQRRGRRRAPALHRGNDRTREGGAAHPSERRRERAPARGTLRRPRGRRDAARRADVPLRGPPRLAVLPHRRGARLPPRLHPGRLPRGGGNEPRHLLHAHPDDSSSASSARGGWATSTSRASAG